MFVGKLGVKARDSKPGDRPGFRWNLRKQEDWKQLEKRNNQTLDLREFLSGKKAAIRK